MLFDRLRGCSNVALHRIVGSHRGKPTFVHGPARTDRQHTGDRLSERRTLRHICPEFYCISRSLFCSGRSSGAFFANCRGLHRSRTIGVETRTEFHGMSRYDLRRREVSIIRKSVMPIIAISDNQPVRRRHDNRTCG
jgi:hypothetical protein